MHPANYYVKEFVRYIPKMKVLVAHSLPIMGGVNQCIMMSLSMAVIASMIGAGGLGGEVLRAIQTVNVGLAFESGLAVVLLAILFDRSYPIYPGPLTNIIGPLLNGLGI